MNTKNGYRTAFFIAMIALILMTLTSAALVTMYMRGDAFLQKLDAERNDSAVETAAELAEKQQRIDRLEKILERAGIDESLISDSDLEGPAAETVPADTAPEGSDSTAQTDDSNRTTTKAPKTQKATQYNPPARSDNDENWSADWD